MNVADVLFVLWSTGFAGTCFFVVAKRLWLARPRSEKAVSSVAHERVVLARPCSGAEPLLLDALLSTGAVVGISPVEVVLSTVGESDAAYPVAVAAAHGLRGAGLNARAVAVSTAALNRKVGQLHEVLSDLSLVGMPITYLVVCDSDVDLTGVRLADLLDPMRNSDTVDAVWLPPFEEARSDTTSADLASMAVLTTSLHAFPVLSGLDPKGLVGKAFAVRVAALTALGGMARFASVLGEDMELSRCIQQSGHRAIALPTAVRSQAVGRSWAAVVDRYARWLTVIHTQRPALLASYPLLICAGPLLSLAVLLTQRGNLVVASFTLALVARVLVAVVARLSTRGTLTAWLPVEIVVGDLLILAAFLRSLGRRRITWRGRSFDVGPRGRMREVSPQPKPTATVAAVR